MGPEKFFKNAVYNRDEYLHPILRPFFSITVDRLQFFLEGRIPSKKNSRVTNRKTGRSFPSPEYKAWHEEASGQIVRAKVPCRSLRSLRGVILNIFFPDKRIADLTNKAESIMDLLVDMRVVENDDWKNTGPILLNPIFSADEPGAMIDLFFEYDESVKQSEMRLR